MCVCVHMYVCVNYIYNLTQNSVTMTSEYQCRSCWKLQVIMDKINEIKKFNPEGKLKEINMMCLMKVIHNITAEPKIAAQTNNKWALLTSQN